MGKRWRFPLLSDESTAMQVYKSGFMLGRPSKSATRTYVFIGVERGGTSPIAGVARALGLYLGEHLGNNNEDPQFVHRPLSDIGNVIKLRNARHKVWGWKFPKAVHELPIYLDQVRSPHVVATYRDPVAVALGHHKWDGPEMAKPIQLCLTEAAAYEVQNIGFVMGSGVPALVISYELFNKNPSDAIDMIADFIGARRPDDGLRSKIIDYVSGDSYKDFSDFFA